MSSIRRDARRRGLRMAAQVAAITGFVAAGAAFSHAAEPPRAPLGAGRDVASEIGDDDDVNDNSTTPTEVGTAEALRIRNSASCGCAPCWGPPAPPAMRPELFDLFEEEAS